MTSADRQTLRQAIDAHKRAALAQHPLGRQGCAGCGAHRDHNTLGCKRCWERHRNRERRLEPAYAENERDRQRRSRARLNEKLARRERHHDAKARSR